jgi:hypothetical protein
VISRYSRKRGSRALRTLAVGAFVFHPLAGAAQVIDTLALREHTRVLSADSMAGRGAGTQGEHMAAAYIAGTLKELGLRAFGDDFRQPVPLARVLVDPASTLVLRRGASARVTDSLVFRHGSHFTFNTGGPAAFRDFSGEAVLVGSPEQALASTRATDASTVGGRVLVVLAPLAADALELIPRWTAAGVAGVIIALADTGQYQLYARSRGAERFYVDAAVNDPIWQPDLPVLLAGPELLAALLTGARLPRAIVDGGPMDPVPLDRSIAVDLVTTAQPVRSANLAAWLPGADPARAHEFIAFSAHYDHLGLGAADAKGDSVYNGFSDNAAGVAMLLAIAAALRDAPPPRSVLFLFFTAEERGLLGSSYYVSNPVVPNDSIVALINLDAGAPPAPPVSWRLAGDSTILRPLARSVAAARGWAVQFSPATPNSDYWPFVRAGVPAVFIVPGNEWEDTTPQQREALRRRWDHYHAASDEWSPAFPFSGVARYADFALALGRAAATSTNH